MNIHKLEVILGEMRQMRFAHAAEADERVRLWADRIGAAMTEHLIEELGTSALIQGAPALSGEPGGHGWDADDDLRAD